MGVVYDGSTQHSAATYSGAAIQLSPVLACWFKPDTLPGAGTVYYLFQLVSSGLGGGRFYALGIDASGTVFAVHRWQNNLGTVIEQGTASSANTVTTGAWNHILGYFAPVSTWQRAVILNGGAIGTDNTVVTASLVNTLVLAKNNMGAGSSWFDGTIAEPCFWDADNSIPFLFDQWEDFEDAMYNCQQRHCMYEADYIDVYYPLYTTNDTLPWFKNTTTSGTMQLTHTGSPTDGEHPILNGPWKSNPRGIVNRGILQVIGRTQFIGDVQGLATV